MAVSNAFEELSAVVARLEAADADVRAATVQESELGPGGELTAKLTVAVPLFAASSLGDGITIEAENADVQDQRVSVDLTVTVPVTDDDPANTLAGLVDQPNSAGRSDSTPAYKDRDALATAYAECDTFPEMTTALGVDVTSETVRRHAIKYGIHDPDDSTPRAGQDGILGEGQGTETGEDAEAAEPGAVAGPTATGSGDSGTAEAPRSEDERSAADETANQAGDAPANSSESSDHGAHASSQAAKPVLDSPLADRPVAEFLSKTGEKDQETTAVTDGLGVSSDLTVGKLTTAINRSRTVHEAKQHLDMSGNNARQLLQRLDLVQFVSHPLATDQIEVSPEEVVRRIDPERA
ncbi:hypothetical protein [Halorientalis regularis]|uniref:Uncharacterized protein n=1 Tax=Halorientalis regularis TaxID=660518 RepID=A0A1G7KCH9_9EURY|nr:hypothetical protein [Halorientalis regularis]SDF34998.1 hypothetical protein SAMN05216218_105256 [Halorientalis regularis]